jgi:hypothetical protein
MIVCINTLRLGEEGEDGGVAKNSFGVTVSCTYDDSAGSSRKGRVVNDRKKLPHHVACRMSHVAPCAVMHSLFPPLGKECIKALRRL